jgi:hypothetical protein
MKRFFLLAMVALLESTAFAQKVIWEREGPVFGTDTGFPGRFDAGEDVNGDGVGDVVAGSPSFGVGSDQRSRPKTRRHKREERDGSACWAPMSSQ